METLEQARRILKTYAEWLNRIDELVGMLATARFNVESIRILRGGDENNEHVLKHASKLHEVQVQLEASEKVTLIQAGVLSMAELHNRYEMILAAANYVQSVNQAYIAMQLREVVLRNSNTAQEGELEKISADIQLAEKQLSAAIQALDATLFPAPTLALVE